MSKRPAVSYPCGCGREDGPWRHVYNVCGHHAAEQRARHPHQDKKDIRHRCGCRYEYEADDGPCAMGHTVLVDRETLCPEHRRVGLVKTLREALGALQTHDRAHPRQCSAEPSTT